MKKKIKQLKATRHAKKHAVKKAPVTKRDIDFVSYEPVSKQKEIPRAHVLLARIFQSLAYVCLFIGCVVLIGSIVGLFITYWPQPEAIPANNTGDSTWINIQFLTYSLIMWQPAVIIFEIIISVLGIMIIIWGWRLAVRTTRRLTWRLADALMKPIALVEPILLLTAWALVIIALWFLVEDKFFWVASVASIILLVIGQVSFLAMRKLSGNYLDYTRAELVWR